MRTPIAIRLRISRTLAFSLICILTGPVAAEGVHNTLAKICQGINGGAWAVASAGGIATPPTFPVTKLSFDSIAYGNNISLKFCPPVINAPPAVQKDPDPTPDSTGHECYATFHQGKTADYYNNLYGASRWNKKDLAWGDFGKPYVYDFNTGAYVRVVHPARRMDVDNVFQTRHLRNIPDSYDPGDIQLPIGYNSVQWRADTTISAADIALPIIFVWILPAGNTDAEKAAAKSAPKVEEAATEMTEQLVKGTTDQSGIVSRLFPKWLTKNLLEAAIQEGAGQYSNSPTLNWIATEIGKEELFNGFRTGMFLPRRDLVATGISVNTDDQVVWVYDNDPPTLTSNTDPDTFPSTIKPLISYDPNTDTYYVEATGPGIADASVTQMAKSLLKATDTCQGTRPPLNPFRLSGVGVPATPQVWHPGDTGSLEWQVQDSGPNHSGQPNLSNAVTQNFGVRDTHPPILIPPPSKVVEIDPGSSASVALGAPRYFDLADYTPDVSNSVGADTLNVTRAGINTIAWTATDASGNSVTQEQLINVKLTGTNTAPIAHDQSVDAVSYKPVEIVLTGYDADVAPGGRHDPLSFTIRDNPAHGHFIAPLLPYFIDDYRLGPNALRFANDPQQNDPTGFCTSQSSSYSGAWQMQYPYNAHWISVNDDGSTVVYDEGNIICSDSGIDSANAKRLAMFDVNGNLVNAAPTGDIFINAVYMDWITKGIYIAFNTDPGTGDIAYYDKDFNSLGSFSTSANSSTQFANPVAITADQQGIVFIANTGQIAAFQGPSSATALATDNSYRFLGMVADTNDPNITGKIKSLATDSHNNLYVSMDNRVLKYSASSVSTDPNTNVSTFVPGSFVGWLGACDTNLTNTTYACDTVKHVSLGFACSDSLCGVDGVTFGDLPGQFSDTRGLAVDPHDVLYVSDYNNSRIERFTSDGVFAGQAKSTGAGYGFILGDFGNPENITVNSDHLYILNKYLLHSLKTTPVTPIDDSSAHVTYQSDNNFVGTDYFSFEVTDGLASDTGNVAVNVTRNYRPPEVSVPPSYTLDEDGSVNVTLVGTDPDGSLDVLSYSIFTQPKHGTLSGSGANLVYTPEPYYYGIDSFSYTVSDGVYSSAPTTVNLTITPVPHAPQLTAPATQDEGLGFGFDLPVEVFDPDPDETLLVTVDWGDGSNSSSGVLVDQHNVPVDAGNVIQADGALLSGLQSSTGGPVIALSTNGKANPSFHHAYATSGDHVATICVTDQILTDPASAVQSPSGNSHAPVCTTTTFSVTLKADLLMSITASPDHADSGDTTQFSLTVTNRPFDVTVTEVAQGQDASNVVVSGESSKHLTLNTGNVDQGSCTTNTASFNCTLGTLAYGSSATITIEVSIDTLAPGNAQLSLFANRSSDTVAALDSEISGSVGIDPSTNAPVADSLSSTSGSTDGGESITITGQGFDALASIQFGTYEATGVTVVDSSHITLTTPAQPAGVVDVTVTNFDGQTSTLAHTFLYMTPSPDDVSGSGGSGSGCSMSRGARDGAFDPGFCLMLLVSVIYLARPRRVNR